LEPKILASPAYKADGMLVITFDEGSGSNRVMTAVSGPGIAAGARSHVRLTHYGLLAGIEVHFGVRPLHRARDARRLRL